jgi:hypothetical protein
MEDDAQKILVVCSFSEKDVKFPTPKGFGMERAKLILCNYAQPNRNKLKPYECKVYLWKK